MSIHAIDAVQFLQQVDLDTAPILDVRTSAEIRHDALDNIIAIPLDQLSVDTLNEHLNAVAATETIYLICQSGQRARLAAEKLADQIAQPLRVVDGGMQAIRKAQGIQPAKQIISLERQVRIAAGALVLSGVLAGFWLHPAGFVLSGLVGAGLIFAGITNTCAMGMLMAKAPWNR